jgi:ribosomal-protein-alanine N-acetyltransferase
MSAVLKPLEAGLEPMTVGHLDAVLAIEQRAYSHPWSQANFIDSMAVGYHCRALVGPANTPETTSARTPDETLIGYYVAMMGVDEVHLLNITVAPEFQQQGWAPLMLEALAGWARSQKAQWLWLEVRASNLRALAIYARNGFRRVGLRKGYYPGVAAPREDAVVMSLRLDGSPS